MGRGGKEMKTSRPNEEVEEDRISTLPDDLIHRILSFVDTNDAIQTSILSTRWKHVWQSLHHLNFDWFRFSRMPDFRKFVTQFLSNRNPDSDISALNLICTGGAIHQSLIKKIAVYSASHNVQRLDMSCYVISGNRYFKCGGVIPLPLSDFSCGSLKQLCLQTKGIRVSNVPKSTWTLTALTTLVLEQVSFEFCCDSHSSKSADPFSNLPNLKNLTLSECCTEGLKVFNVISPQLETLSVTGGYYRYRCEFVVLAPKLVSFAYCSDYGLIMSANDLRCLDQIDINIGGLGDYDTLFWEYETRQKLGGEIINMFRQLRGARSVSLTLYTIEVISWLLDSLKNEPSPFCNMECLKIEGWQYRFAHATNLPIGVITYLCNSSPNSTVSIEAKSAFENLDTGEG